MFKFLFRFTALTLLLALASSEEYTERTYDGYTLYRVYPQNPLQVEKLRNLSSEKRENGIEFWTEPNDQGTPVDIMTSPEEQECLQSQLRIHRIPFKTIMYDVGEVIRRTQRMKSPSSLSYLDDESANVSLKLRQEDLVAKRFFTEFQRYSTIELKLKELAKDSRVTLETPGLTYDKRQMYLVKVSSNPAANKPVIFIDAGHHAREWISHSTLLYILESLLNDDMPKIRSPRLDCNGDDSIHGNASNEIDVDEKARFVKDIKTKLDEYDFWFIPVVNPDGYEYTFTSDRLWRKTRSRGRFCNGVDPNRNYPFHWLEAGASEMPCDQTYAGPSPLSEPETKIVANTLDRNKDRIVMYLSLHAYSQLLLVPYGHAEVYPENYDQLKDVARAGMNAIYRVRGTSYKFGPSAIVLYPAAGGSDDYAYATAKIRLAYTIELPDTGQYGFLLPPQDIIPVGQETTNGITAMIEAMKNLKA